MADPILVGGIRVQAIFQGVSGLPQDRYINTFCFASDVADTQVAQEAAMGRVKDFYENTPASFSNPVLSYMAGDAIDLAASELRAYWMGQPPPRDPRIFPFTTTAALSTADPLPSEVALCVSYYAGTNHPRNRGRFYVGPLSVAAMNTGATGPSRPGSTFFHTCSMAARALADDSIVATPRWCVLGKSADGSGRELKVITNGWVDNSWDTMRGRGEDPTDREPWAL